VPDDIINDPVNREIELLILSGLSRYEATVHVLSRSGPVPLPFLEALKYTCARPDQYDALKK